MYAEKLKREEAYNDVVLFSISMYKVERTVGTEPSIMYPIGSSIETEAGGNLINAAFTESRGNSRIKR